MKTQGIIAKSIAVGLLTFTAVVAFRPAPAEAFGPISAVGGVLNAAAGAAIANDEVQAPEASAEKQSFAEALFGLDEDTGATSVAEAVRDPRLVRAVAERATR